MSNYYDHKRVVVTGGAGFLGSFLCEALARRGCSEILIPRSAEYDLVDNRAVAAMYRDLRPDMVIHLAAAVGGIGANRKYPGSFFYKNLMMGTQLIEEARLYDLEKFVAVGTVCAYPKFTPVPFREDDLWNGYPEETNAPYGLAKKMLLVQLQAYREEYNFNGVYVLPVNLYGERDNFDPVTSHVIPALIAKCLEARATNASAITCWGTGNASREFLYAGDAAEGILAAAERYDGALPINLGTGQEITIADLAKKIAEATGFRGQILWNPEKPDGQPRRCLDTQRARSLLDWEATTDLDEGLKRTVDWYLSCRCGSHDLP